MLNKCPSCNHKNTLNQYKKRVKIAPFIVDICKLNDRFTKLNKCLNCEFSFYEKRFSDEELANLYQFYRSKKYLKLRNKYEFWYTESRQRALENNPKIIDEREQSLIKILTKNNIQLAKNNYVLDYGGNDGSLIKNLTNKAYVFDVNNAKLVKNVKRLKKDNNLAMFDLTICSNVLEHINNPYKFIKNISSKLSKGSYLYIDVPNENPMSIRSRIISLAKSCLEIVSVKFNLSLFTMHEHINFFSELSLCKLVKNLEMEVLESGIERKNKLNHIYVLAKVKNL
jgi:hypothetical protein